jgi:NOL1/NOP2/sun family putative RNA methylase
MKGYSDFALKRYRDLIGELPTKELLKSNDKPLPATIRCNTNLITPDELRKKLSKKRVKLKVSNLAKHIFFVTKSPFSLGATTEYLSGYYYVQDMAAMCPPLELEAKGLVVDMCAAPGGKTTHLSQLNPESTVLALDIDRHRMKSLRSNVQRCNCTNTVLMRMDSRNFDQLGIEPDSILIDPPCSAEGIIRKDPSAKTRILKRRIDKYVEIQKEIIDVACTSLKKGGKLVYSTCTIAPEENEFQIRYMVEELGMKLEPLKLKWYSPGLTKIFDQELDNKYKMCGRLWPHVQNTTGFFVARLSKP